MIEDYPTPQPPKKKSQFVTRVNAVSPLIVLFIVGLMVILGTRNPNLWEEQGFVFTIGTLLGNSSTASLTQRDREDTTYDY